jgi:hypothetical protein
LASIIDTHRRRAAGVAVWIGPASRFCSSTQAPSHRGLRLLVVRAGYPPPETQIPVHNEYGELIGIVDMGWRDRKIAVGYEGDHHRSPAVFAKDIRRMDAMTEAGWIVVRVTARDTEATILRLIANARSGA